MNFEMIIAVLLFCLWTINSVAADAAKSGVAADDVLKTTNPGRKPAANLKMKSSRVPQFVISTAKGSLPRLDIGEETSFEATSGTAALPVAPAPIAFRVEKRASPPTPKADKKRAPASAALTDARRATVATPSAAPAVAPVTLPADPTLAESHPETTPVKEMTPDEMKLLEAHISLENHESPETALGLVVELLDHKELSTEARYTYALAARKLGLDSEFRSTLFKMANETKSKDWGRRATESLAREAAVLNVNDMKNLSELVTRYGVDVSENDAYQFLRAKYNLDKGDLSQVLDALESIPEKSKYRGDARLISALFEYRRGDLKEAQSQLEKLLAEKNVREDLRDVAVLTLARIQFQRDQYKDAFQNYMKVSRASPLWMEAAVEQAWAQILVQDYEGAAGNMFSLHTDFFKNAFSPDSYVVRTIAYLNLCQFGDGLQALQNMQRRYGGLVGRLETYKTSHKTSADYYATVKTWLQHADLKEVDGLPRSFIVELARHPSFMKPQGQINAFEDEIESFNKANLVLIQREKELLQKQTQAKDDLNRMNERNAGLKTSDAALKITRDGLERQIAILKGQHTLAKRARGFIKQARERALARMEKEKVDLKAKAAEGLKGRFQTLLAQLTQSLDQSEVLRYELLAGAGEHLRSQTAGAALNEKERPEMKPAAEKSMKWKFRGEIWEDEIGHYRSSLKNVCPADDKVASY